MFKRLICILMAIVLIFALCSCSNKNSFDNIAANFDNYILGDYQSEYDSIVEEYETALQEKDNMRMSELKKDLKELEEQVVAANEEQLKEIIEAMKTEAESLGNEEKAQLTSVIESAEKKMSEKKYRAAYEDLFGYAMLAPEYFEAENELEMNISQVDCSEYPTVRLYLNVADDEGETPKSLDKKFFSVIERNSKMRYQISNVMQLDQQEGISINMVADSSGSMSGSAIATAKSTMAQFLKQIQYQYGDTVALTVFSNNIEIQTGFTSDYSEIESKINSISSHGGTALYDTLYTSVQYTARQNGARCVIAFTDGNDEHSKSADENDVIRIANDYKIPIFIIGIDVADTGEMRKIAESTGGFYRNIASVNDLSEVYNAIYRQQKEMYVVEYTADESAKYSNHEVDVLYLSPDFGGEARGYSFTPSITNPATNDNNGGELETAIKGYLESYVMAMNTSDPTYMLPYVIADCPLYNMQKNYINNDYEEELLSFYICSEVNYESADSCVLSVHEVYNVTVPGEPMKHHEQVATYRMKKDTDGKWKMYEFVGGVKNHL